MWNHQVDFSRCASWFDSSSCLLPPPDGTDLTKETKCFICLSVFCSKPGTEWLWIFYNCKGLIRLKSLVKPQTVTKMSPLTLIANLACLRVCLIFLLKTVIRGFLQRKTELQPLPPKPKGIKLSANVVHLCTYGVCGFSSREFFRWLIMHNLHRRFRRWRRSATGDVFIPSKLPFDDGRPHSTHK